MLLMSTISYLDRITLAQLAPTILKESHLSGEDYGFIISGFSFAYMISNLLWGKILDRIGLRWGMLMAVSFWTLASMAHAFASGFWSFALARIALGLGEGATFPGSLRTVMQTLGPTERARGIAVSYSGGSMGAILTPLIVTPIALKFGWRTAFLFTGIIGLAWVTLWWFVSRRPDVRDFSKRPADTSTATPRFADPRLWSFMFAYAFGGLPLAFVLYGAPVYLSQAMSKSQAFIGAVMWIPPLGWEVGYFVWGWLLDRDAARGVPKLVAVRKLMAISLVLSLPLALVPWMSSVWLVMAELFLAMFVTAGFVIPSVSYATHVFSSNHSGFIGGLGAGSWGAGVALVMPLIGRLFDRHDYQTAFALASLIPVLGYVSWRWINAAGLSNVQAPMSTRSPG